MVDTADMLQCPVCGDFYEPVKTVTARSIPHCTLTVKPDMSYGQLMEYGSVHPLFEEDPWRPKVVVTTKPSGEQVAWVRGEVEMDFAAIEARVVTNMGLTEAVVDPPLTVTFSRGFRMFGLSVWEIILLIVLAAFLIWVDSAPAYGQCLMSYCKPGVSERTIITNTHRQVVGDLYTPVPGQRTQIRDTSRRIIGYIEMDGSITNTHRQKKGQLND